VRGLFPASSPRVGSQRHAEFATFGELHASGRHPTTIGTMAVQSLTYIPASTLLLSHNAVNTRRGTSPLDQVVPGLVSRER
jgi:hypothetical protein